MLAADFLPILPLLWNKISLFFELNTIGRAAGRKTQFYSFFFLRKTLMEKKIPNQSSKLCQLHLEFAAVRKCWDFASIPYEMR